MMKNILFNEQLARDVRKTSNKKAKLNKRETKIVQRFYNSVSETGLRGLLPCSKALGKTQIESEFFLYFFRIVSNLGESII